MSGSTTTSSSPQDYHRVLHQVRTATLRPSAKAVAFALLTRAGNKLLAFPSLKTIAQDSGLSVRGVRLALRALEEAKIILTIPRKRKDGSATSNVYRFICSGGQETSAAHEVKDKSNEKHTGRASQYGSRKNRGSFRIEPQEFKKALTCWNTLKIAQTHKYVSENDATLVHWFSSWAKCLRLWREGKIDNPGGLLTSVIKRNELGTFYANKDQDAGMIALRNVRKMGVPAYC